MRLDLEQSETSWHDVEVSLVNDGLDEVWVDLEHTPLFVYDENLPRLFFPKRKKDKKTFLHAGASLRQRKLAFTGLSGINFSEIRVEKFHNFDETKLSSVESNGKVSEKIKDQVSFYKLSPGANLTRTFDLRESYNFQVTNSLPLYASLEFTNLFNGFDSMQIEPKGLAIKSNEIWVTLPEENLILNQLQEDPPRQCTSSENSIISDALEGATNSIEHALLELPEYQYTLFPNYLVDLNHWFNSESNLTPEQLEEANSNAELKAGYDIIADLVATTLTDFTNSADATENQPVTFSCSGIHCSPGTFAYVYPAQTNEKVVFLCDVFWLVSSDAFTRDSQPGTIVHELSHFQDVGGTFDYAYGTPAIDQLAQTNIIQARDNADNWEAFTETLAIDPELRESIAETIEGFPTLPGVDIQPEEEDNGDNAANNDNDSGNEFDEAIVLIAIVAALVVVVAFFILAVYKMRSTTQAKQPSEEVPKENNAEKKETP